MGILNKLFGKPAKPPALLDDVQTVSSRLIVKGYRKIAAKHGCAPTAKTTDQQIVEIHTLVSTAFNQAAKQRGEKIPALIDNYITLKMFQVFEMLGEQGFQNHLQYEVEKYLGEGLRPDYKQEVALFDPNGNDPDVKMLHSLMEKAVLGKGESKIENCYKKAEAGDAESQYTIGIQIENGQSGFEQDYFEAAKWYERAALQGHAAAQLYFGVFLAQGKGVQQNVVEAYKWLDLAKRGSLLDKVAASDSQKRLASYLTSEQIAEGQRRARNFVPTKDTGTHIPPTLKTDRNDEFTTELEKARNIINYINNLPPPSPNDKINIVHIDDEEWLLEMVKDTFRNNPAFKNVTLRSFQNRDEAYSYMSKAAEDYPDSEGYPDLLITDLFSDNLPLQTKYFGMNGLELLSKLAEDCVSFPILVFSGSLSNYEITLKAKQCAGEHLKLSFFRKPCTQEQLVSELLTLI